jgi:16S rRNA (adenine1518-N6/adenine1519-N6)-dimethyltransferase
MRYPFRRRRFGQHFLHDPRIIDRIIEAIGPDPAVPVVEIGPGRGALTAPLLRKLGRLDVVEIDADLAAQLPGRCAGLGNLQVHRCDALRFELASLGPGMRRCVGNLPYNVSTPLLFHLLEQAQGIVDMIFMLQKEVVDRLAAGPGSRQYGRLSVMVQARCRVERLFTVGAACFQPPPRVDSAVVRLTPIRAYDGRVRNHGLFADLVRRAFHQRRKMLRNSVYEMLPGGEKDLEHAGLQGTLRAEDVSVAQYMTLANYLATARLSA